MDADVTSAAVVLGVPLSSVELLRALVTEINVNIPHRRHTIITLIDSSAQKNFINQILVKDTEIPSKRSNIKV